MGAALPMPPTAARAMAARPNGRLLYLVLLVALVPPALALLLPGQADSARQRFEQTLSRHPEVAAALEGLPEDATLDQVLDRFPEHRLDGALHARDTRMHWGYAGLSAGLSFGLALTVLPRAGARARHLLAAGAFTATLGILLRLGVQLAAQLTYGRAYVGRSVVVLLFYLVKFVGFSYRAALDPGVGFLPSLFGFTFGVGMCEVVCKALPLLWAFRAGGGLGWRDACRWGFICGVGFGVSEGVTYAGDHYNGIDGGGSYLVRFVSCVALHAVWTAAAGVSLFRRQGLLHDSGHWVQTLLSVVAILIVPMVLHGLYDTFLKRDMGGMALAAAVVSLGWLALQIEQMLRAERDDPRLARALA